MKLTAGAPLPALLKALARAGWGALDTYATQGIRSTLHALNSLLDPKSAAGTVTVNQVADAAGLSSRWTARCLRLLEDAGLISWARGQLLNGTPIPGFIRVSKQALLDLIQPARAAHDDRVRERRAATRTRVASTLRRHTQRPRPTKKTPPQQKPLPVRVELSSTLPPYGEESRASVPVEQPPIGFRVAQLREAMRQRQQESVQ